MQFFKNYEAAKAWLLSVTENAARPASAIYWHRGVAYVANLQRQWWGDRGVEIINAGDNLNSLMRWHCLRGVNTHTLVWDGTPPQTSGAFRADLPPCKWPGRVHY